MRWGGVAPWGGGGVNVLFIDLSCDRKIRPHSRWTAPAEKEAGGVTSGACLWAHALS